MNRPCQVLAEGPSKLGGRRGSDVLDSCEAPAEGNEADAGATKTFEQTTHVTLMITSDSATHQPGLYLRYRDTFPNAEAAARYEQRVQDWLATRPDPADEAPAPVIVEQPRSLHEILRFHEDDAKFARRVEKPRPFDWARE